MKYLLAISILCSAAALADPAGSLNAVFAHIDSAARTFKGMSADVSDTEYTALVDDKDTHAGSIRLDRAKDGAHLIVDLTGAETVALNPREAKVYNPKTNVVDVWPLANRQAMVNQFMLLGFGAASAELKAVYDISWAGDETIDGQPTAHLKLIPKSPDTRRTLKEADLWYGEDGLVRQQKFLYPSGNYKLVTYSNMSLRAIPEKELELKPAKGAVVQKH